MRLDNTLIATQHRIEMTTTDYMGLATAIAEAMGGTVEQQTPEYANGNFVLSLPKRDPDAGLLLRFSPYRAKDRLVITPSFNALKSRRGHTVSAGTYLRRDTLDEIGYTGEITVSLKKSPNAIVSDIARRLLAPYLTALGLVRAELQKESDEEALRDAAMQKFAGIVGECWSPGDRGNRRLHVHRTNTPAGYSATLELHTSRECSLEIRWASTELTEKILNVLAQHGEARA